MIVAVINETSAADKNADILAALEGRRFTIVNAGMQKKWRQTRADLHPLTEKIPSRNPGKL